jgi:hypothetical protein
MSDDKSYTNFSELMCCCQEEEQVEFLEWDLSFQQGKWILVALATVKMKKHSI